jgi:hypothetical protein
MYTPQSFGYDFNDAFFYIRSSNAANIAQFGSSMPNASIAIYPFANTAYAYYIGVENSNNPTLTIGQGSTKTVYINSRTQTLSVNGDIALTGRLIQSSNAGPAEFNNLIVSNNAQSNTLTLSSPCNISTLSFFTGNNAETAYYIACENPDDSRMWIGRESKTLTIISQSNTVDLLGRLRVHHPLACNVALLGSSQSVSTIGLYTNSQSNSCFFIGAEQNNRSLWVGKQSATSNAIDTLVHIDSTIPSVTVRGNGFFTSNLYVGQTLHASNINIYGLVQTVNQTIVNSQRIILDNSDDGPALSVKQRGGFDVATFESNSTRALHINSAGFVGIGGTFEPLYPMHVKGVFTVEDGVCIQQMGNIQNISMCAGQVQITSTGTHQAGFVLTWAVDAVSEAEMFDADVRFFGSGYQTRTYMTFSQLINPVNNGMTLPSGDICTEYKQLKYKTYPNIKYAKGSITRAGARAVRIAVEWRSDIVSNYRVNLKASVMLPKHLGFVSVASFYRKV